MHAWIFVKQPGSKHAAYVRHLLCSDQIFLHAAFFLTFRLFPFFLPTFCLLEYIKSVNTMEVNKTTLHPCGGSMRRIMSRMWCNLISTYTGVPNHIRRRMGIEEMNNGNVCSTVTIDRLPRATKLHGCQLFCWLDALTFSFLSLKHASHDFGGGNDVLTLWIQPLHKSVPKSQFFFHFLCFLFYFIENCNVCKLRIKKHSYNSAIF